MSADGAVGYGEIYDRGYQHYDGPRLGRLHAVWALARYSMGRALGLRKPWTAKVIPILLYAAVLVPVVVSVGVRAFLAQLLPGANLLDYPEYFAGVFLVLGIFVATITPEMLCPDRQERVLPLYFSRAITRGDYVVGKLLAAALLTLTVSFVPAAIMWVGRQLLEPSPLRAFRDHLDDLGRIAVAGGLMAAYLGAIGLAISSFTGRKSVAVGVIILGFLLTEFLTGALTFALEGNSAVQRWLLFLSPSRTCAALVTGLWGAETGDPLMEHPVPVVAAGMVVVTLVCLGVMAWRYRSRD